ncbi:aminotransferase class V-fold PLP-dependent enzyme [Sporosarcina sp. G11-34]|uniref:aminotransferase class V-fold PLP-dependent enzyme n=1 Tax=Sporosarcina sp. G11-34 TaxID=2849605 RepID=UPI0022A9BC8B|nr:aminotransferase class V-fold PLP-dependent enzyme [Sporosarcina sp. G11-34]MCZ2259123.1 aminotransferase class V-fold PLP-dependent enzyme [Sporosarcina sp. G11-34]
MSFVYKIAETPLEFEQIHQLNYETFVEEIPQHERNSSRALMDKFHDENTYIICKKEGRVIGMLAIRSKRPFSLDGKIGEIEGHLSFNVENPVEIRLLSIEKKYRNGRAFLGLTQALVGYCLKVGYDSAFISGTVREQKLYGQLGFMPFAHLTGKAGAEFQPMYLTRKTFDAGIAGRLAKPCVNFLPGPVTIAKEVQNAMMAQPFSHRSTEFESMLKRVKDKLTTLTSAKHVQLLQGTGTLANDVVAAQLTTRGGKGLILVNGEFGSRLIDHATRFGMDFETLKVEWGSKFDEKSIVKAVAEGNYNWLWAVHCETSTGVLNDLDMLKEVCGESNATLAIDSVSSIGAMPVNLDGITYASGVSGKGLLSYTGISFVFHNEDVFPNQTLPRYLDLGAYAKAGGIPYSQSSNLLSALDVALCKYDNSAEVFAQVGDRARKVRKVVEEIGLKILAQESIAASTILTLELPLDLSATRFGNDLFLNGFHVHYESSYLKERNWLQIACMNDVSDKDLDDLLDVFRKLYQCSCSI